MVEILVGADPEVFVKKDNKFVSGYNLIPGTKVNPHKVKDGAVQVDGMALEFNIAPAKNADEFVHNIESVLLQLKSMVPEYDLAISSVADFDKKYIEDQPKEAKELGCDPDFNAYTLQANPRPNGEVAFRTAAGHVHIGFGDFPEYKSANHMEDCSVLVKQLDMLLGVPSVLFDKEGSRRRNLYGKAGAFRPKPYGVEYRVLSNKWLESKELMKFVYKQAIRAVEDTMNNKLWYLDKAYSRHAQTAINYSDDYTAKLVMDKLGIKPEW
jgi:hypothetical protein